MIIHNKINIWNSFGDWYISDNAMTYADVDVFDEHKMGTIFWAQLINVG